MDIQLSPDLRIQYAGVYLYSDAVIKKIGISNFFLNNRYKQYRELFVGAIIAQMVTEFLGVYNFVSPGEDPPDFTLRELRKHVEDNQKTDEVKYSFEVTDYTEYEASIDVVIDKKLENNKLAGQSLVVFFKHSSEVEYDLPALRKKYANINEWILIVMRVDRTKAGILLPEERWLVTSVTKPYLQKLIKPDKRYKASMDQMYVIQHRGRDKTFDIKPVHIKLPD